MYVGIPFFNIIRVPEGHEDKALAVWREISDLMEASDGCISTRLHRNLNHPRLFVNQALFTDMEAFIRLSQTEEFTQLSQELTDLGVEREAGIYEVVHAFSSE